jgi:hypothetical protein
MEDKDGDELSITLYLGETVDNAEEADKNIGGLPGLESPLDDGDACFVTTVTSTNPNVGIKVQVGGKGKELCSMGTTIMTSVVETIRTDPPKLDVATGSLVALDPCGVVEDTPVDAALGVSTDKSLYNLHWCTWSADDVNLGVWFRPGYDPKDSSSAGQPVDLGNGVTGYEEATTGAGVTCRLQWLHRKTGDEKASEIVAINLDKSSPAAGDNGCPSAVAIAQLLIPALPKP